jgi:hypothetical protein
MFFFAGMIAITVTDISGITLVDQTWTMANHASKYLVTLLCHYHFSTVWKSTRAFPEGFLYGGQKMYPPMPNRKNQKRSMFQAEEPEAKSTRTATSECFQQQADSSLSGPSGKGNSSKSCAETSNDGLPSLSLVSGSSKITSEQASTASGSNDALKGMNVDSDQVKQMMALNATPELFQELKDQDPDAAADAAVRDPNLQRQALHETGDEAFADRVRSRIGSEST